jgi:hypothetical protein
VICHNRGVNARPGPAVAGLLAALVLAGCGGTQSSESPVGSSSEAATTPSAPVPAQIVAPTNDGDVFVIDRETEESRVIASFPPRDDPQVEAGSFRAVDVVALPDGRFLLATCCEPAAGHMYALSEDGHRLKDQDLFAEDAGHDADKRVASGELVGLVIRALPDLASATATLGLPPGLSGFAPRTSPGRPTRIASSSRSEESSPSSTPLPVPSSMRPTWRRLPAPTGRVPPTRRTVRSRSSKAANSFILPVQVGSCAWIWRQASPRCSSPRRVASRISRLIQAAVTCSGSKAGASAGWRAPKAGRSTEPSSRRAGLTAPA